MISKPRDELEEIQRLLQYKEEYAYAPEVYLALAEWYTANHFPDLAAGDAYKALLLSDELREESGEYHSDVLEHIEDSVSCARAHQHADADPRNGVEIPFYSELVSQFVADESVSDTLEHLSSSIADSVAVRSYGLLAMTLSLCGCYKSAYDFACRGSQVFPNVQSLSKHKSIICEQSRKSTTRAQTDTMEQLKMSNLSLADRFPLHASNDLSEEGLVRRERYIWNEHEPDRLSPHKLKELNERLRDVAPKCEVRSVSLPLLSSKAAQENSVSNVGFEPQSNESSSTQSSTIEQLGLFTIEDIAPHEIVLNERSILAANNRLYDPLCDACSGPLPPFSASNPLPTCDDCEDTIFCSEACASLAQELYHPAVCGKDDFDLLTKDPLPNAASSALYLALLGRALAMAETQGVHPLDLPEVKYLWGDFNATVPGHDHEEERKLPFTFHDNILAPLSILEKMDVNIFTSPLAETWVTNTLFAKFRGTASARFSTAGVARGPEVAAVHPMWCLANHSCAPNVKWEWGSNIKYEARGGRDVVRWGPGAEIGKRRRDTLRNEEDENPKEWQGGIRKGEEIFNHYCDIDLLVADRREWAKGALGGRCMCKRCLWEERQDRSS